MKREKNDEIQKFRCISEKIWRICERIKEIWWDNENVDEM